MFAGLWKKLLGALGAVLALGAIVGAAWWKGRSGAKKEDAAKAQAVHDHEVAQSAKETQATQDDAAAAADAVEKKAAAAPPPDTEERDDLEGTE